MAEYIEREKAYTLAKKICDAVNSGTRALFLGRDILDWIDDLPAADVRPVVKAVWKHVQWVVDEEWQEGGYWISRCSNCSMPYHTETPFSPHCGADMRKVT